MGLFDSMYFSCLKCKRHLEVQTKAGPDPCLRIYTVDNAPEAVIKDIENETVYCAKCNVEYKIEFKPVIKYTSELIELDRGQY